MLRFTPFYPDNTARWDAFVRTARNGVFLFERSYMDYHAARFEDASLMIWRGDDLIALLPAHRLDSEGGPVLVSHSGLTFGGLILHGALRAQDTLEIVDGLCAKLRSESWHALRVRPVPHIFHRQPSEDELYALLRRGARVVRSDLAHTVDLARRPPLAGGRRNARSRARRAGVQVRRSNDWAAAWTLVEAVLAARHGALPTHALHEIVTLAQRFERISLHAAFPGDATNAPPLAVAVTYAYDGVLHTQYLAASEAGREIGALDAVIEMLLEHPPAGTRWLSFGVSTYDQGRQLNAGLAAQKEMFGARPTLLTTLELDPRESFQ
jgi:hypothetical protein